MGAEAEVPSAIGSRSEAEDEEVEAHRVNERRGKDGVVRARHDTALAGDPDSRQENTLENERPMTEDDDDDRNDDALVMRPQCHPVQQC